MEVVVLFFGRVPLVADGGIVSNETTSQILVLLSNLNIEK